MYWPLRPVEQIELSCMPADRRGLLRSVEGIGPLACARAPLGLRQAVVGEPPTPPVPVSGTDRRWRGRGRPGRAIHPVAGPRPGPGVASPPMPPRPSAPVLRGSRRGPPRVRGWAMGGGAVGGGAGPPGRGAGPSGRGPSIPCPPRRGGPPPPLASPCRRGVVRTLLVGGPPPRVRGVWCHPCAAGRIAIVRLVVEGRLTTGRALPYRVEGRGGLPGGRCRGGGHGRGSVSRSVRRPCVSPKCRPCALSCHPAAPCVAGAAARALRARWPSVFGLAAAGAVPHSHRGAPARPACRRGAAVGVAAAMIPVHSDPPASRRRAAVSQFPAEKDYPGACDHSDSAAPRRGDPRFVRSLHRLVLVYCDIDLTRA